ncbi:hypothetical protein EGH24_00690 [Halonotius terrestris]|uniref:HTH domain protein n=1 Tax=Halonotius terrestris TaxID=2487750 RepID=A0A8J8TDJ1_9EURY|nr:hypothetical protein [Halonotius terrestris]TQQ83352.1 hypothetical protein EGH24_00690 [Halonotius terrestris]
MRTVRDADGDRYLLVKQSGDSSLVRDPQSGAEHYVANDDLDVVDEESPLATAAAGIDPAVRRLLTATYDDQSLGLLVELVDRGPISTVGLLDSYDLCESDLHGLLAEFRAAGLVEEAERAGERGYDATAIASEAVEKLRDSETSETASTARE